MATHEQFEEIELNLNRLFPSRSVKRVLLIAPPDAEVGMFQYATAKRRRYPNYPPYGLAVLAQKLRDIGIEVTITNLNHEILKNCCLSGSEAAFDFDKVWQDKLDFDLGAFKPDLVGVTCMFTMAHNSFRNVCNWVKAAGHPVAIGGVHVTNDVERVLDDIPSADIAFVYEGDIAVQRFIQVVNGDSNMADLGQIILTEGKSRLRLLSECRPSTGDVNVVPAFDLLLLDELSEYGTVGAFYFFKPRGTRFATALSSRGCRGQCTFCSVRTFNGEGVRQRSVTSVVDELEILKNVHGIEHIMWLDDDLLKDSRRAIALFNEIVRRNLGITWDATNGLITYSCENDVIAAAAESGCIAVNIGMESGNPMILRRIKKPGRVENFIRTAEIFRKFENIHVSVLLMVGFPGETMRMVQDTINVARAMDLDWHRIAQLQPLPNTPIYDSMVAQGLIEGVGSQNVRFTGGAFGKQVDIEQGRTMAAPRFDEAFSQISFDQVPTAEQLTDVWFYMNYHLNFHRLFTESRPIKIEQQLKNLKNLSDIISPENGFALYFLGYLQQKIYGTMDTDILVRLESRIATSIYWKDRLQAFGLSIEDLRTNNYKNKEIPRIVAGRLPGDLAIPPVLGPQ